MSVTYLQPRWKTVNKRLKQVNIMEYLIDKFRKAAPEVEGLKEGVFDPNNFAIARLNAELGRLDITDYFSSAIKNEITTEANIKSATNHFIYNEERLNCYKKDELAKSEHAFYQNNKLDLYVLGFTNECGKRYYKNPTSGTMYFGVEETHSLADILRELGLDCQRYDSVDVPGMEDKYYSHEDYDSFITYLKKLGISSRYSRPFYDGNETDIIVEVYVESGRWLSPDAAVSVPTSNSGWIAKYPTVVKYTDVITQFNQESYKLTDLNITAPIATLMNFGGRGGSYAVFKFLKPGQVSPYRNTVNYAVPDYSTVTHSGLVEDAPSE